MNKRLAIASMGASIMLAMPFIALAAGNGGQVLGILQEAKNSARLERATGVIGGMTNKLQNLSQQLDTHQSNVETRIQAITKAGHQIHVDTQLSAFKEAIANAKGDIQSTIDALQQLPESDKPSQQVLQARALVRDLAVKLAAVRTTFLTLQQAVVQQLQAERSSSTPTP